MTNDPGAGMVLSEFSIRNFRSCYDTTVALRPDVTVLVGENNSGKSNVIEALRLALAPHGVRRARYFDRADLSFGRDSGTAEFVATFDQLTSIQRGMYVTALNLDDMTVRYTTRFTVDPERPNRSRPIVFVGPGDAPETEPEMRDNLRHVYLEPLRDAQRELDSSGSRRLAAIIELLHTPEAVDSFIASVNKDLRRIEDDDVVTNTQKKIAAHLTKLTNPVRTQEMGIRFTDYRLYRLAAALRLKMAEAGIPLADLTDSGLGYANLLYISTVLLELHNAKDAELTVLLVEEPEAHLHPQLQTVLLAYLMDQAKNSGRHDSTGPAGRIQVVVTTHSPVVAAGTPVRNVVLLRSDHFTEPNPAYVSDDLRDDLDPADDGGDDPGLAAKVTRTTTRAIPIACLGLDERDMRKIDQYLDATKAALLFGTRVVLVEGISEAVLLPVIARHIYKGPGALQVERRWRAVSGLTIINIGSVDFEPYVRLLLNRYKDLSVLDRLIVVTDTDPPLADDSLEEDGKNDVDDQDGRGGRAPAKSRIERLMDLAVADPRLVVKAAPHTLEADLLSIASNQQVLRTAFLAQKPRSELTWQAFVQAVDPAEAFYRRLRTQSNFISKGQFAHDLAIAITDGALFEPPKYLAEAIAAALDPW